MRINDEGTAVHDLQFWNLSKFIIIVPHIEIFSINNYTKPGGSERLAANPISIIPNHMLE